MIRRNYLTPVADVISKLSTDSNKGLNEDEAKRRLEIYGDNAVEGKKKNPIWEFLSYFWGPIPWMIEIAAILAGSVRRWEEFGVILFLLSVNGGVSYWHERRANQAIEALKKEMALNARVIRDGKALPQLEAIHTLGSHSNTWNLARGVWLDNNPDRMDKCRLCVGLCPSRRTTHLEWGEDTHLEDTEQDEEARGGGTQYLEVDRRLQLWL